MPRGRLLALVPWARAALLYVPQLGPYPGYTGDFQSVSGTVRIVAALDGSPQQALSWDLQGLDTACTNHSGAGVENACGIHVHTGSSCAAAEGVGGHFYGTEQDPWGAAVYESDGSGASVSQTQLEIGLSLSQLNGRALVVHQLAGGRRIACGILFAAPAIRAVDFSKYPVGNDAGVSDDGYDQEEREVAVSGVPDGVQVLTWELSGLDEQCYMGPAAGVPNSCGIHVHTGICTKSRADIGAHYYNMDELEGVDPWPSVAYVASGMEGFSMGYVQVTTGLSLRELVGRTVVWHNYDGKPHACATLDACVGTLVMQGGEAVQASRMGTFTLTELPLAPQHDHRPIYSNAAGEFLYYWMQYKDWRIGADYMTENCGVQSGGGSATCPTAAERWAAWTGAAWGAEYPIVVETPTVLAVSKLDVYPGYSGSLTSTGTVVITGDLTQTLRWDLAGLDTECVAGAGADEANGCGIHVHAGGSCANPSGHLYNAEDYNSSDPWADVVYVSDGAGSSSSSMTVTTGLRLWELAGRVLVIHALAGGERVACGEVVAGPMATVDEFSAYPGYSGNLSVEGTVSIVSTGEGIQVLSWELAGADGACSSPGAGAGVTNACGIHVHAGLSCDGAGGHLYNESLLGASDPWAGVLYVANGSGWSQGVATVETGLAMSEIVGRAFVVHELELGGRIACAMVGAPVPSPPAPMEQIVSGSLAGVRSAWLVSGLGLAAVLACSA